MTETPRIWVLWAMLALTATFFAFVGCDGGGAGDVVVEENEPIRVGLNIWPGYGAFFIADEKGLFAEEGVAVDLQIIQGDAERDAALVAGRIDGIGMTLDNLAILRARGVPVKAVLKYDESFGADGIIASESIATIGDLRGREVAWATGTPSHFFLIEALKTVGLTTEDLAHRPMASDQAGAAFAAGQIEAAVTWEPWLSLARDSSEGRVLVSTRELPVIHDVLFFREELLEFRPADVEAFLRACFSAIEYWEENPAEGNQIIANALDLPLADVEEMLSGIRIFDAQDNGEFFGSEDEPGPVHAAYEAAIAAWIEAGILSEDDRTSVAGGIHLGLLPDSR